MCTLIGERIYVNEKGIPTPKWKVLKIVLEICLFSTSCSKIKFRVSMNTNSQNVYIRIKYKNSQNYYCILKIKVILFALNPYANHSIISFMKHALLIFYVYLYCNKKHYAPTS